MLGDFGSREGFAASGPVADLFRRRLGTPSEGPVTPPLAGPGTAAEADLLLVPRHLRTGGQWEPHLSDDPPAGRLRDLEAAWPVTERESAAMSKNPRRLRPGCAGANHTTEESS